MTQQQAGRGPLSSCPPPQNWRWSGNMRPDPAHYWLVLQDVLRRARLIQSPPHPPAPRRLLPVRPQSCFAASPWHQTLAYFSRPWCLPKALGYRASRQSTAMQHQPIWTEKCPTSSLPTPSHFHIMIAAAACQQTGRLQLSDGCSDRIGTK